MPSPTRKIARKRATATPAPEPSKAEVADAEVDEALAAFSAESLRTDSKGVIKGLDPDARYYVMKLDAGEGGRRSVQFPPTAKLRPPRVRRSLLVVVESNDEAANPTT